MPNTTSCQAQPNPQPNPCNHPYYIQKLFKPNGRSALPRECVVTEPQGRDQPDTTKWPSHPCTLNLPKLPKTPPIIPDPRGKHVVIALIPTANTTKSKVIQERLLFTRPQWVAREDLHFVTVPADSGVGEQPYDGAGLRGAYNRIVNAVQLALGGDADGVGRRAVDKVLRGLTGNEQVTVLAGAVENFISRQRTDLKERLPGGLERDVVRPVDYGVVAFCRVGLGGAQPWVWRARVSEGVTVPTEYWRATEAMWGFEDGEKKQHGKVTVGSVIAANVPGVDKADWHMALTKTETSRYTILMKAMQNLTVPWPEPNR
ncbi:hypothetical protein VTK26DRAFT_9321 [Humicola hyalothermophila]